MIQGLWRGLACLGAVLFAATLAAAEPDAKGVQFFEKKIRPVLVQQCYKCHSAESKSVKANLLLDMRDGIRRGGETGPAVVPGDVEASLLISALRHEDFEMPPKGKLPADVVADFVTWVKMGAPDPRKGASVAAVEPKQIDWKQARQFWSFQPVKETAPPELKEDNWSRDAIDRYVFAARRRNGLSVVADAERTALCRRVYFDLTGLPPTPREVEAFLSDKSPQALESLVDRLLDSPRFGERWGRHWLDVARYADSNGNVDNTAFPHAWRYRDYVIASFNKDKPYDQFLTEQLAGDLLTADSSARRNEQLVATGFLAIGSKPRSQNNPDFQMDVVAEQIEVTTSAMLGLTVMCARCHDHKFDPIPTSEYYSLAGIFTSTKTLYQSGAPAKKNRNRATGLVSLLADDPQQRALRERYESRLQELTRQQRETKSQLGQTDDDGAGDKDTMQIRKLRQQLAKLTAGGKSAKRKAQIQRVKARLSALGAGLAKDNAARGRATAKPRAANTAALRKRLGDIEDEIAALRGKAPQPAGVAMGAAEGTPADCQICIAGQSQKRGERAPRGMITVATIGEPPRIAPDHSGRLELAGWITDEANPLTARVMVNRIWYHLFGRGLVVSLDNFGALGEQPSHPELLDHLAARFVRDGWSVKRMIRAIMLSRTYGLSSSHDEVNYEKDPDNVYLWRVNPQRLDAESLRDAILAVSGELDLQPPGPPRIEQTNRKQTPVAGGGNYRSVYLPIVRNGVPEALGLFDFADPSIVVGRREITTVPTQSLFMMNSPFILTQSQALARRLQQEVSEGGDGARVERLYLLAFGRRPTDTQRERAIGFVADMSEKLKSRDAAWTTLCQTLLASAEFRYLD